MDNRSAKICEKVSEQIGEDKIVSLSGNPFKACFAEYVKAPAMNVVKFDETVSFEQCAFFEPSTVALHGIKCVPYTGGEYVAILGGGTIGLFTMQWAKILGAKKVVVFDINDSRVFLKRSA